MIDFRPRMDKYALEVRRTDSCDNSTIIASIQWHPGRAPRIVWDVDKLFSIDLWEVQLIVGRLE